MYPPFCSDTGSGMDTPESRLAADDASRNSQVDLPFSSDNLGRERLEPLTLSTSPTYPPHQIVPSTQRLNTLLHIPHAVANQLSRVGVASELGGQENLSPLLLMQTAEGQTATAWARAANTSLQEPSALTAKAPLVDPNPVTPSSTSGSSDNTPFSTSSSRATQVQFSVETENHELQPHRTARQATSVSAESFFPINIDEATEPLLWPRTPLGASGFRLLKDTLVIIRFLYLHLLLRLPYVYHSRAVPSLLHANLILERTTQGDLLDHDDVEINWTIDPALHRAYKRHKGSWEVFIDSLLRDWKTFNIISGLLLSGVLTVLQLEGASSDPVTRYFAFWSLISALLRQLHGPRKYNSRRKTGFGMSGLCYPCLLFGLPGQSLRIFVASCLSCGVYDHQADQAPSLPKSDQPQKQHYGSQLDKSWINRIKGELEKQQANRNQPGPEPSPPVRVREVIPPTPPQNRAPRLPTLSLDSIPIPASESPRRIDSDEIS
ncbi:hypothetical protein NP233_g5035 [Leucocoprinus birnbaumii]|uniref:Uncharacterized protein n=1 Tax=Leucocoprinus birnbaumii TaxID=56174 RepID=A0AAD5VTN3_9AGAR|nr:hypothetical protein NP233_g5035 [Leucocoprinus birnbaumii]